MRLLRLPLGLSLMTCNPSLERDVYLYGAGHAIVPGTVTPGTLLYHGGIFDRTGHPPPGPEWVAFDPEYSYLYSSTLHTFQVVQPLKVLYFDGTRSVAGPAYFAHDCALLSPDFCFCVSCQCSSAGLSGASTPTGVMDTMDIMMYGKIHDESQAVLHDWDRINELCEWGRQYGLDGYVR